ncbi:unnamed protein product (macronuclear) [Paramecium tetraurelia]|uniref:Uncharacterized protein n=1 Tax=Paramecium tetraurelia TaxID=5888 RepID=A0DCW8_PARTE|nr:uncharacterized protein GSPATT00015744001 [Paramecium tetraurelia]CAK80885.1 unnamed protein product [Paramecium tetraurelia]|eukprot:XP_001448282.1 hypothetical protein (macronuclear) [Paramecium tetraurelia strain d4-2]
MEFIQEITLLKESFLEFIIKVTPVFTESILEQFNSKWNPLKKLLSDPSKSASDVFLLVSSMSSLKKSTTSSTSATSPNSDCSVQKITKDRQFSQEIQLTSRLKRDNQSKRAGQSVIVQRAQNRQSLYQNNIFLNTPRARPTSQQEIGSNNEKMYEEDMKAKILKDDIKCMMLLFTELVLNQLRVQTPEKKVSVTVRCNLGLKLSEAISQFRKDNFTLKTVHERSTEIMSPQSERSESPLLFVYRPKNQYFQQPVLMQQQQAGALKGYSIYSKKGYIQPIQFDVQFQMLRQQHQNNITYRKLYI